MKRNFLLWVALVTLSGANFSNAAITGVIVYPQGAQVKEEKPLTLQQGENIIQWGTLGQGVDADSVRVILPEAARLIDRTVKTEQVAMENGTKRAELEKSLRIAERKVRELSDHLSLLAKDAEYLEQIQKASTTPVKGEAAYAFPTTTQWNELILFTGESRGRLLADQRNTEANKEVAQREVAALRREIEGLNNVETLYTQKLTLKVESLKKQEGTAAVTYFENNASWRPSYQVWVDATTKAVQLTYGALVRQSSPNAWEGVALTLSTARPRSSAVPPELKPWWVREYKNEPRPMMAGSARSNMMMKNSVALDSAAAPAAMAMEMEFEPVVAVQNLTFAEYKIPGKNTIPADNDEHRFVVADVPLKGDLSYKIVPEVSKDAYLQAKVTNGSEFTFLPGESQLYSDGNFVGHSNLKIVQPAESFDLNLGIDPAISVERKLLNKKTELTGILDDNRKITYSYEVTLKNLKRSDQTLTLEEHLPVSQHEKIKVELLEPKELAANFSKNVDKEGKLKWGLTLKAGEEKKLSLKYSVEYPKAMQVEGL